MVSIKEVAKKADVSISTVSNVLNNKKFVSPALTQRVKKAVKELDFCANPFAQRMKLKNVNTVGIIAVDLAGMFYPYIVKGAYDVFNARGYKLTAMSLDGARDKITVQERLKNALLSLIQNRVGGILFPAMVSADYYEKELSPIIEKARKNTNTAFVCLEGDLTAYNVDSIFTNCILWADRAVSHLIETGCKKIGHVSGPKFFPIIQDRISGYKNAVLRAGLPIDEDKMIAEGDYSHQSGYRAAKELLSKMPDIDGIFAANDQMSVGVLKALFEAGRKVPEDVKVISFDDVLIASILEPSISTVHIEKSFMGQKAAEILLDAIEKPASPKKPVRIELDAKLIIRKSTLKDAIDDWNILDY
jgi:DNA-binding LacI/PurR family transcriptional regulator